MTFYYSLVAIVVRVILCYFLFQTGKGALDPRKRNAARMVYFASFISLLLGFYAYLFTLILLIHLGIRIWTRRQRRLSYRMDLFIFLLTAAIFVKGPGDFSLDHLLGNV